MMGLFAGSPLGIIKHLKDVLTIIRCKVSSFYDRAASSLSADDLLIVAGYLDSSAAGRHGLSVDIIITTTNIIRTLFIVAALLQLQSPLVEDD